MWVEFSLHGTCSVKSMNHVDTTQGAVVVVLEPFEDAVFVEPVVATVVVVIRRFFASLFQPGHRVADHIWVKADATAFVVFVSRLGSTETHVIEQGGDRKIGPDAAVDIGLVIRGNSGIVGIAARRIIVACARARRCG